MAEDLREFEEWLSRIREGLAPAKRRRAGTRLGQALRRANLKRITANVEPEGGSMEPRKASVNERGRIRRKAGTRMFRRLRFARSWKLDIDADGIELTPASAAIDRVGAVHHFGQTAVVGRLRDGRRIRTRYAERRLLGFSQEDRDEVLEAASSLIDPDAAQ